MLNASLALEQTLAGLGRLVVPEIADHCVVDLVEADDAPAARARDLRVRSALAVPLQAHGRVVGVLSLVHSVSGRTQGEEELLLARRLADRAAVAIDNARLHHRERERALTLQRSLLPDRLPVVPGLTRRPATCPPAATAARWAGTGTTWCGCRAAASRSSSATSWAAGCPRPH